MRYRVALCAAVPSVTSTTRPPGFSTSSGRRQCDVIRCVSMASRNKWRLSSRSSSQIGLSHISGPPLRTSPPQMSFTSTSMCPKSCRIWAASRCTWVLSRWSVGTAMPWPPSPVTSSAVSSIVSGRSYSERAERVVRPVQITVAPASPSAMAMPRPAPRVAPATTAIRLRMALRSGVQDMPPSLRGTAHAKPRSCSATAIYAAHPWSKGQFVRGRNVRKQAFCSVTMRNHASY